MTVRRTAFVGLLAFAAGLAAGLALSPWRWAITSDGAALYRTDRLTGKSWRSISGRGWQPISELPPLPGGWTDAAH
jgi:hypothetical protein